MSGSPIRGWSITGIRVSRVWWQSRIARLHQEQLNPVWLQGRERVGARRLGTAHQEQDRTEEATSYYNGAGTNSHGAGEASSGSTYSKGRSYDEAGGRNGKENPESNSSTVGGGEFFADTFAKGFSFASSSATAGLKRLKDVKIVDTVKGGYTFLKEELNSPASRRRTKEATAPMSGVEKSSETTIVPMVEQRSAWQKQLDDIFEKARQHPAYKRLRSVKQHPVVAKSQELAEDLRERWETSDSPVVHKIQDLNDSIFGETATAVTMKEIRRRDPSFSVSDFILEVQEDVRPILRAYLKGDFATLRKKCSHEVVDRCRAERLAFESQGIYLDHKLLHISDVEVKETKLMGNSPIVIVAFRTQQTYCARDKIGNIRQGAEDDIQTVYYAWAMQQLALGDLDEGDIHPRWQLREMQQLGIQAII